MVKRIGYSPKIANKMKKGDMNVYAVNRLRTVSVNKRRLGGTGCGDSAVAVSAMKHLQVGKDKSESERRELPPYSDSDGLRAERASEE
ncbi:hypothetical protein ABER23_14710 [Paenibacillus lautus]|uniref:hypothetical protein n=1 Tax=Paenibacillus lautus TaxID=1401 RepID=UPI003D2D2338